jgi:hypothetical protein
VSTPDSDELVLVVQALDEVGHGRLADTNKGVNRSQHSFAPALDGRDGATECLGEAPNGWKR